MTHSSINKHLIVNGCSFTNGNFGTGSNTWANVVRDYFEDTDILYKNIGWKGSSNDLIIPQTLEHISQIDKNDKVVVIIQLTALDRVVVNGRKSPTIGSVLKSLNWMKWGMSQNTSNGISKLLDFQIRMLSFKNVDYKIFCGWDILTQDSNKSDMWDLKVPYENKSDKLISELYPSIHEKFNQLNLNKFWFFENDKIHYGGLSQWVQYNVHVKDWYRDIYSKPIDYHPSDNAHKLFAKKVMIPIIKKML